MLDKSMFKGYKLPILRHPELKDDEVFIGFVREHELGEEMIWENVRIGEPEDHETGKIFPVFLKKQEVIDAGVVLVPARNLEEEAAGHGFKEVAPGVMVNTKSGFTVSIPHPDPCWVLQSEISQKTLANCSGVLIFSSADKAESFYEKVSAEAGLDESIFPKEMSWDEFVDTHREAGNAIVDHEGGSGFYATVPIKKGI